MKVNKLTTIKSKTNFGEFAKQTVYHLNANKMEDGISIVKLVLVQEKQMFDSYCRNGFAIGRKYKGKTLMQQVFSIKVSSFQSINKSLNKFFEDENQRNRNR